MKCFGDKPKVLELNMGKLKPLNPAEDVIHAMKEYCETAAMVFSHLLWPYWSWIGFQSSTDGAVQCKNETF